MKKIFFVLVLATGLATTVSAQKWDDDRKKIEGSGKVVTKEVAVQSFDELKASGLYSLQLIQGNSEAVKIEAEDNLQELFEVKNEGTKLVIKMKKDINIKTKEKMKVYVTFKKLKNMELNMVGNVSSDKNLGFTDLKINNNSVGSVDLQLTAGKLEVKNQSVGNIKLSGKADHAIIKNSGVGSIQAAAFVVQTMDIDNSGVGAAEVNAEKELKVKDSFLGKVKNKGNAPVKKSGKTTI